MGNPLRTVLCTHSNHPLPEDRRVNERVTPQNISKTRKAPDQFSHPIVLDKSHRTLHYRCQIVIHRSEMEALKIGDVAGNVKCEYLTLPTIHDLVALKPSFEDEAALGWLIPLADHIVLRTHFANGNTKTEDCLLFLTRERRFTLKLSNEGAQSMTHVSGSLA
jgi:hypothetical protein